jgi:hypothetical protein
MNELIQARRLPLTPKPNVDELLRARLPKEMHGAIEHAHGTEDPVYAPSPSPRMLQGLLTGAAMEDWEGYWLPEGLHYDLHIEHRPLESAGEFTGGGNKWLWHITVSPWATVDSMWVVVRDKRASPTLIIGGRPGWKLPVVIQCMPFNRAARALAHPSGPETNRADVTQVEICANVADVPRFDENERYLAFANLVKLANIRMPENREIPRRLARSFSNTERFGGQEFVDVAGHCGHMHAPKNDHGDPTTAFMGSRLMDRLENFPDGGYDLNP